MFIHVRHVGQQKSSIWYWGLWMSKNQCWEVILMEWNCWFLPQINLTWTQRVRKLFRALDLFYHLLNSLIYNSFLRIFDIKIKIRESRFKILKFSFETYVLLNFFVQFAYSGVIGGVNDGQFLWGLFRKKKIDKTIERVPKTEAAVTPKMKFYNNLDIPPGFE